MCGALLFLIVPNTLAIFSICLIKYGLSKKSKRIISIIIFNILFCALADAWIISNKGFAPHSNLGLFVGRINKYVGCDTTCYSSDFNNERFLNHAVGDSYEAVLNSLGKPLYTMPLKGDLLTRYTESCGDSDYFEKVIYINSSTKQVVKIYNGYYFD